MPTRSGGASVNESVREIPKAPLEPIEYVKYEGPYKNDITNAYEVAKQQMEEQAEGYSFFQKNEMADRGLSAEEKTTAERVWSQVMSNIDNGILGHFKGLQPNGLADKDELRGPRVGYDIVDGGRNAMIYAYSNDYDGNMGRKVDLFKMPNTLTGDSRKESKFDVKGERVTTADVVVGLVNREFTDTATFLPRNESFRKIEVAQTPLQVDKVERARQAALLHRSQRAGGNEAELMEIAKERNASILRQRTARG
jgi:hypothetical protein